MGDAFLLDILASIPVHYCQMCKKLFIGAKTYTQFVKTFGKLMVCTRKSIDDNFYMFSLETRLHGLGYNVVEGGMTDAERQMLLRSLLENNCITYFEICATIERSINFFQNIEGYQNAVSKWKTDLEFISKCVLNSNDGT